jgi:peptidoglycan/xylan/chitin deacetylase (PgdA/CDA1 family)
MNRINISIGFDVERPHGEFTNLKTATKVRQKQLTFTRKIIKLLDENEVPRTFFILGNYLDKSLEDFSIEELQEVFNKDNPLNEIQQHSYSHIMFRSIQERPEKRIVTSEEFGRDLQKANDRIKTVLGVVPYGFRAPFGYYQDMSDKPELLVELDRLRFLYVSSDLRSEHSLKAPLTAQRQPHTYYRVGFPNIVEIPSHGWQDAIFTNEMALKFLGKKPISESKKILSHYIGLIEKAQNIKSRETAIFVSFCLHPWAMIEYDRKLKVLRRIIESRSTNIEIVSYATIAKKVLSSGKTNSLF